MQTPHEATIVGTTGILRIAPPFWKPSRLSLSIEGRADETIERPITGNGFNYEAAEVMACLRGGRTESTLLPLDETLAVMRTLDAIRAQIGLRYPGE
jgi:predicted dehydrogenase